MANNITSRYKDLSQFLICWICGLTLFSLLHSKSAHSGWLAVTDEGTWLSSETSTVYLQGFSPYHTLFNLAVLAGTKYLSTLTESTYQYFPGSEWLTEYAPLWWHRLSLLTGLTAGGWSLSSWVDSLELVSGAGQQVVIDVGLPEIARRMVLIQQFHGGVPVLVVLRNPLSEPGSDIPDREGVGGDNVGGDDVSGDRVSRLLLDLHREMSRNHCERLEVHPVRDAQGLSILMNWRIEGGQWQRLNVGDRFLPGSKVQWLSFTRSADTAVTVLQPEVLEYILKIFKAGRSAGIAGSELIEPLAVNRGGDTHWAVTLNRDPLVPVLLEGVDNSDGTVRSLKLYRIDEADVPEGEEGTLYYVPRSWTALAQFAVNIGSLLVNVSHTVEEELMPPLQEGRFALIKAGKAGVGAGAMAAGGIGFTATIVEADDVYNRKSRLKDSNRVILGHGAYQDLFNAGGDLPFQIELAGAGGTRAWAMPYDETADRGEIMMSRHLMKRLRLKPGDEVTFRPADNLKAATMVGVEVLTGPERTEEQLAELVEKACDIRYPVLHRDERIYIREKKQEWCLRIDQLQPEDVVSAINVDAEMLVKRPSYWPDYSGSKTLRLVTRPFQGKGYKLRTGEVMPPLKRPRHESDDEEVVLDPSEDRPEPYKSRYKVRGKSVTMKDASDQTDGTVPYARSTEEFAQAQKEAERREEHEKFMKATRKLGRKNQSGHESDSDSGFESDEHVE